MVAYRSPPGTSTSVYFGFWGHGLLKIPFSHCRGVPNVPIGWPGSWFGGISASRKGPVRQGFGEDGWLLVVVGVEGDGTVDVDGVGWCSARGIFGISGFAAAGGPGRCSGISSRGQVKGSVISTVR